MVLKIYTLEDTFIFTNKDAENVYSIINDAGARNAEWTVPASLSSGKKIVFVLKNIIAFEYE